MTTHSPVAVEHAGISIIGRSRELNEDAWGAFPTLGVFVVADGCGARSSGRGPADIAVQTIERHLLDGLHPRVEPLASAIDEANTQVRLAAVGEHRGDGATMAALRVAPPWIVAANVGDCRIYRYRRGYHASDARADTRGGALTRVTTDDSLWLHMLKAGASFDSVTGAYDTHRNVVVQTLGVGERVDVHVQYTKLQTGDLYLLCSDGVTAQLGDIDIRDCISDESVALAARCARLVRKADEGAGADNVTAVLVQC